VGNQIPGAEMKSPENQKKPGSVIIFLNGQLTPV
jgi:hypothetical protein